MSNLKVAYALSAYENYKGLQFDDTNENNYTDLALKIKNKTLYIILKDKDSLIAAIKQYVIYDNNSKEFELVRISYFIPGIQNTILADALGILTSSIQTNPYIVTPQGIKQLVFIKNNKENVDIPVNFKTTVP